MASAPATWGVLTGAQNIGFAIPITLARDVMEQIIEYGSVRRGWLGASFSDLRPTAQPDGSARRARDQCQGSSREVDRPGTQAFARAISSSVLAVSTGG